MSKTLFDAYVANNNASLDISKPAEISLDLVQESTTKSQYEVDDDFFTKDTLVQESFGMTLAEEWIKKPEVIKEINDTIDERFISLFPAGMKPSESDLAENRKKILAMTKDPHVIMMTYAKKSFDKMVKEEQNVEADKMREAMRKEMEKRLAAMKTKTHTESYEAVVDDFFTKDTLVQESYEIVTESKKEDSNRAKNLKSLKYNPDDSTIEIIDDTGESKRVKISINDDRALRETIKNLDAELKRTFKTNSVEENKQLLSQRNALVEKLTEIVDDGPTASAGWAIAGVGEDKRINITAHELDHMSADELNAVFEHEKEHIRQFTRGSGVQADHPNVYVIDDASYQFIKNYRDTDAGRELSADHDRLVTEMCADAAAIRKYGYKKFMRGLRKIIRNMTSKEQIKASYLKDIEQLNADFKRLDKMMVIVGDDDSEMSDEELHKLFKSVRDKTDHLSVGIQRAIKQIMYTAKTGDGAIKKMAKALCLGLLKAIQSAKEPKKLCSKYVEKEMATRLDPTQRREALRYLHDSEFKKQLDKQFGITNFDEKYTKIINRNIRALAAREKFAKAYYDWYKARSKRYIKESFEIIFGDEVVLEEYVLDAMAESIVNCESFLFEDGSVYLESDDEYDDNFDYSSFIQEAMEEVISNDREDKTDEPTMETFSLFDRSILNHSRFYQEDGEDTTIEEMEKTAEELEDTSEDKDKTDDTSETESKEDDDNTPPEEKDVSVEIDIEDADLSSFGTDTSDVQNEFNPKDVEILNKLVAAESEAINDYFDAAKDCNDETLRRLYGDIGHEERFHLEQLLYAKSTLTGERYEPRDPEIKREYEELLAMGMDEDTAANTAIDKTHNLGADDGDDSDVESLAQESAMLFSDMYREKLMFEMCIDNFKHISSGDELGVFVEAYITEAVDNVSSAPKELKEIPNPISLLAKAFKGFINALIRLSRIVQESFTRSRIKHARRAEWIKNHGIGALFQSGIKFYFYDDEKSKFDITRPIQYCDMLYRMTVDVGKRCGIQVTSKRAPISNPIKYANLDDALNKINSTVFTTTKVVVNEQNKAMLTKEFFGYTDKKINVKMIHGEGEVKAINDSDNVYNKLAVLIEVTKQYADISLEVLDQLEKLQGNVNSVFYKNRSVYNESVRIMKAVVKKYNEFISAIGHDMKEMLRLDNGLLEMTRKRDTVEQSGKQWEGPDIRTASDQSTVDKTGNTGKYTKTAI